MGAPARDMLGWEVSGSVVLAAPLRPAPVLGGRGHGAGPTPAVGFTCPGGTGGRGHGAGLTPAVLRLSWGDGILEVQCLDGAVYIAPAVGFSAWEWTPRSPRSLQRGLGYVDCSGGAGGGAPRKVA